MARARASSSAEVCCVRATTRCSVSPKASTMPSACSPIVAALSLILAASRCSASVEEVADSRRRAPTGPASSRPRVPRSGGPRRRRRCRSRWRGRKRLAVSPTRAARRLSASSKLRTISPARGAERRGAVGDAVGEPLVGCVEDAAELAGAGFELLRAVGDAGDELLVGAVEDAAEFGRAGGERVGGFADAHAEPLVGIVEIAQDVAGAGRQRTRRLHGARDQPLVGFVERTGDLLGAACHAVGDLVAMRNQRDRRLLGARASRWSASSMMREISPARSDMRLATSSPRASSVLDVTSVRAAICRRPRRRPWRCPRRARAGRWTSARRARRSAGRRR